MDVRNPLPLPRLTSSIPSVLDRVGRPFPVSTDIPRFSVAPGLGAAIFAGLGSVRPGMTRTFSLWLLKLPDEVGLRSEPVSDLAVDWVLGLGVVSAASSNVSYNK